MSGKDDAQFEQLGEELMRAGLAWADTLSRAARLLGEAAAGQEGGQEGGRPAPERAEAEGPEIRDLLEAAMRAQMVFAVAGLDYSRRMLDLQTRRGPRVGESIVSALGEGELGEARRRALIDEMRGYMREMGALTLDEAHNVTRALGEIDRRLAAAAARPPGEAPAPGPERGAEGGHSRRWRAKE